ncbi:hypothetical protein KKE68_00330 [Patescibacteria group bacterium]|nr:hypothetical protein [Patescibacteria group bacterium]
MMGNINARDPNLSSIMKLIDNATGPLLLKDKSNIEAAMKHPMAKRV